MGVHVLETDLPDSHGLFGFQLIHDIDDLLEWFGETEQAIAEAEPISSNPDMLRTQLRDHKVSHSSNMSCIPHNDIPLYVLSCTYTLSYGLMVLRLVVSFKANFLMCCLDSM